jgi:hypothetical protein
MKKLILQNRVLFALGAGYLTLVAVGYRIPCPIHATTGVFCPGCGSSRAVSALLHGNFPLAFHQNLLLVLSPLIIGGAVLLKNLKVKSIWLYTYLGLVALGVLLFVLFRNTPGSLIAPI